MYILYNDLTEDYRKGDETNETNSINNLVFRT